MHQLPSSTREASRTTGAAGIRPTVSMEPLYPQYEVGTPPERGGLMTLAFPIAALGTFVVIGLGIGGVATAALVAHNLYSEPWPFPRTSVDLAAAAGALALTAAAPKALGWQRLFRGADRPRSLVLASATAAASVAGIALPSRFDDAVRVAIAHRLSGRRPPVAVLVLSLLLLGMIDAG